MKRLNKFIPIFLILALFASILPALTAAGEPQTQFPVILAPGMTASANWSCFLFESGCDQPENWGWMPTAQGYYQALIDRFAAAGYTQQNGYLTIFLYDWRRPLAENAERLKTHIAQVKATTGASQVNLVGHSMGGLVSRAYVQSAGYAWDVGYLITLGSPHFGAARTYPYWEGAAFYQAGTSERIALSVLLAYYMIQTYNPFPVFVLREKVPSGGNLLPTLDYIYDEDNHDQVIAESSMIHRNSFMHSLNNDLSSLFARTKVTTIAGGSIDTPARLYVHERDWYQWPNWDDGEPNWSRQAEFELPVGDGTVLVSSALLPGATSYTFPNVSHGALPGDEQVIQAIFNTLGIPLPAPKPAQAGSAEPGVIVLMLSGATDAIVTDPLGRTLDKNGSTIPGGEYTYNPNDPFKLIVITNPAEGDFMVKVQSSSAGDFEIGLLDTFSSAEIITDVLSLWDKPRSYMDTGLFTTFNIHYTLSAPTDTVLIATMPIIETPVTFGNQLINGRALPNQVVNIYNAADNRLIGSGVSGSDGHFSAVVLPWKTLTLGQRIYARVGSVSGVAVPVTGINLFLPLVEGQ